MTGQLIEVDGRPALRFERDRATAARTAAGWHRCFARVDALLAGRPMDTAASLDAWPDVHERYAAAWGIDPELGRAAFAAHPAT